MGVTLRFQTTGTVPGSGAPVTMRGESLTIGRAAENDLVLPDPDGLISRRHCVIEDQAGGVVAIDLSTNGTFLNYSKTPIGTTPVNINNGDVITLGGYELVIEIFDDILDPVAPAPVSHGQAERAPDRASLLDATAPGETDFLDDLLGSGAAPKGPGPMMPENIEDGLLPPLGDDADPLLPPAADKTPTVQGASEPDHAPAVQGAFSVPSGSAAVIPDDWDDDFLKPAGGGEALDFGAAAAPEIPPTTAVPVPPAAAPAPAAPPPAAGRADLAFRAFLEGAGASHIDIPADQMPQTMARIGTAFRAMVEGMREVLMTRASIKGEFRINQTMIGAGKNNPLKFSMSADQALEAMVKPQAKGYLDADDAAHQAMRDIKAHEVAMVSGMEAALKGLLARLDPDKVAEKIEDSGVLGGLLKGKKARYWEVYEKMYAEISAEAEEDFQDVFAKEFARAYQAQLDKLK